jgi:hypothetical protein
MDYPAAVTCFVEDFEACIAQALEGALSQARKLLDLTEQFVPR